MFTLKFYRFNKDETSFQTSISCPNYSVYMRTNNNHTITTYNSMLDVDGVERHIVKEGEHEGSDPLYFHSCFIENEKGKTIEHINC